MTRALPRTHFNSSRLTRFLTENAMIDAAPVADDVGQKLGDWLNFRQAIALHGVLNPDQQPAAPQPAYLRRAGLMTAEALTRHVDKVRAQLEQSIAQGASSGSGLTRIDMPSAELDEPIEPKTAYEPYRRFYAAHQRQMEVSLQTLRSQVRGQLSKGAPSLQQLASLDAAFENILSEREAVLLGKVAKLHEKRFAQALKQHIKKQAEAPTEGSDAASASALSPMAWLLPLRQAMRTALLAELDTRLQPVLGLVEAFHQYTPQEQ
ncbi:DUF3348 family protein [Limnohabitans sp. T6-20]|uniref:DUF3348 family protein n=1 Tax=Limnohabitans sp. T6-20 TaxID=1100725 RepID=UPI000D35D49E|nr:DUF3348 family protein [Limnohabitans sp. T6-20]PUE10427.1 hypothetical protein B9Z33_10205 [Limnohabitans sp. T6-20]